jgi:diacylglycerol kinase family enzyme
MVGGGVVHYDAEAAVLSWPAEAVAVADGAVIAVLREEDGYTLLYIDAAGGFQSRSLATPPPSFLAAHAAISRTPPAHLLVPPSPEGRANIHIVVSTLSGTGTASTFYASALVPLLDYLGIAPSSYETHTTTSASTVAELSRAVFLPAAQRGDRQTLILLAGDGGVLDLVNVLNPTVRGENYAPPTLSLHPLGTGNALATSLTLPTDSDQTLALSTLLHGRPRPLPLIRTTFSPGARLQTHHSLPLSPDKPGTIYATVLLSAALHATLVSDSDTPTYRAHGVSRFRLAAQNLLFPEPPETAPHAYKARLTTYPPFPPSKNKTNNTQPRNLPSQTHAYILSTQIPRLEQTFTISPASKPLDGRLWLVRFGPMSGEEVMRLVRLAYAGGKHVDDPAVTYEEIAGLRVDFDEEDERWRKVCVDGAIVVVEEGGWAEVWRDQQRSTVDILIDPRSLSFATTAQPKTTSNN